MNLFSGLKDLNGKGFVFNNVKNLSTEIVNGSHLSVYRNTKLTEKKISKKILVKIESFWIILH